MNYYNFKNIISFSKISKKKNILYYFLFSKKMVENLVTKQGTVKIQNKSIKICHLY